MRTSAIMLLSLLVIGALCVSASAAIETVTCPQPGPINIGWNLLSLPAIPTNPAPPDVFAVYGVDAIDGNLYRWDAAVQGTYQYSQWGGDFGNMLLTDGYWLKLGPEGANQLSFEAITDNDDTDMWISLPKTGWTIIGCPFSYAVNWNTVEITDGTATIPLATARDSGWLVTVTYWWDSTVAGGGMRTMGLDDDYCESTTLEPWHGFWVQSLKDNLALIVPAAT